MFYTKRHYCYIIPATYSTNIKYKDKNNNKNANSDCNKLFK